MKMQLKKNDNIKLKIDNCDLGGNGVGRYDGLAVFVSYTIGGETVNAHILKVKSNCAFAKAEEITDPSPDRIECPCPVYLKCGGCVFGHLTYEKEAEIKANHIRECFRRIGSIEPELEPLIKAENIYGYRNKAQYPVETDGSNIKIGFYAPHSHRVIDCPDCMLQPDDFYEINCVIKKYISENSIDSYDEESHSGLLRHIYIRKGTGTGEIMVCLVINGYSLPDENGLVTALTKANQNIKTVVLNINTERTNVILGKECRTLYGDGYITDTLCSLSFRLSPLSFYQVNREQAQKLYYKAAEYASLTGKETVLDLYCGTGTIGLTMAEKAGRIIGVEIIEQAVKDAEINAEINNIGNAEFICSDASKAAVLLKNKGIRPEVIILDPPRKGCSPDLLKTVSEMSPDRIVYVSCDPATLARDCKILSEHGYKVNRAAPVDMFPKTGHVETVCLISNV